MSSHGAGMSRVVGVAWSGCSAAAASPRSPSTSAWWSLVYIATRPSRSPSIRCHSHSGRSVARRVQCSREQSSSSSRTRPGFGQRAVADVVLDVELVVLAPDPLAGGLDRPVRVLEEERRDVVDVAQLLVQVADVVAARALGLAEQLQPPDVHRHPAVLGHQEARQRSDRGGAPCRRSLPLGDGGQASSRTWHDRAACRPTPLESRRRRAESRTLAAAPRWDRVDRWRAKRWQIAQCAVAAGVAWRIATDVFGHTTPFFAPVAAVVLLGYVLRPAAAPGRRGDGRRRARGLRRRPAGARARLRGWWQLDADRGAVDDRRRCCSTAGSCS